MPDDTMTDVSVAVETTVSYTHKWLPLVVHWSQQSPLWCGCSRVGGTGTCLSWSWDTQGCRLWRFRGFDASRLNSLNLKLHCFVSFCVLNGCNSHVLCGTVDWSWALHTCCGRQLSGHGLCTHAVCGWVKSKEHCKFDVGLHTGPLDRIPSLCCCSVYACNSSGC